MTTKKPYELVDGDVVDMEDVLLALHKSGVPIDMGAFSSAACSYWVVEGEMTPWQRFEGKHVDASLDEAEAVLVNFGSEGLWSLPPEIDLPLAD